MISSDGQYLICDHTGCQRRIKNHQWARIKADDWFEQKDGTLYCPDHHPDWVRAWRRKNKK